MVKVSVISPCFNGEKYLPYFFDSLLSQTFSDVEFIFVNDGSKDKTEDVFLQYQPKLEQKGWHVIYLKQENQGQAAALNFGLKYVGGEYLIWPDSDDILYPNHIARKVELMETNPEAAIGFCRLDKVKENDKNKIVGNICRNLKNEDNLYEDLLKNNNIIWPPIATIVRMKAFDEINPQREIFTGRGGQNFQMLLPLSFKYKACYTEESLGKYVVRKNSDSKVDKTKEQKRFAELFDIWLNTILSLKHISKEDKIFSLLKAAEYYNFIKPEKKRICILGIPFLFVESKKHKRKYKLFNLLNLCTMKMKGNKCCGYLFGFIPLFSIKSVLK